MKIIFLGAPGAGKGTQAEKVAAKLNIPTISTGAIIRSALKEGTEMGLAAKAFIEAGKLVPDDVVIGIIKERLAEMIVKTDLSWTASPVRLHRLRHWMPWALQSTLS